MSTPCLWSVFLLTAVIFLSHADSRRVLMIGIDGLGGDYLALADAPAMSQLRQSGSSSLIMQDVIMTSSSQNWMSMIGGSGPDQHGVYDNGWEVGDSQPTPTVFAVLREQRQNATIGIFHHWEGFGRLVEPGVPDVIESPGDEDDVVQAAIDFILDSRYAPFDLLFVHMDHVDAAGHSTTWGSIPYYNAITKADGLIGDLVEALTDAGLANDTAIVISADHGGRMFFHDPDTSVFRNIPFIVSGHGVRRQVEIGREIRVFDVAATVAALLGLTRPESWIARPVNEVLSDFVPGKNPSQNLVVRMVTEYEWIYDSTGSGATEQVSIWRPVAPSGYVIAGHVAVRGFSKPSFATPVFKYDAALMANPTGLEEMWNDRGSGGDYDVSVWDAIAPYGFTCLGNLAVGTYTTEPPRNTVFCIHSNYLIQDDEPSYIWDDTRSGADWDGSFWGTTTSGSSSAGIDPNTFHARRDHDGPGFNKHYWLNRKVTVIE